MCEICFIWFHIKCQNITVDLYNALTDSSIAIHCYCDRCNRVTSGFVASITALTRRQDAVEIAVKQVEKNVAAIDAKILQSNVQMSTLSADSKQTQNTVGGLTSYIKKLSSRMDNMLTESDEIAKRKTSVVVKGLMESEEVEDIALVTEALKAIEIQDVPIKKPRKPRRRC